MMTSPNHRGSLKGVRLTSHTALVLMVIACFAKESLSLSSSTMRQTTNVPTTGGESNKNGGISSNDSLFPSSFVKLVGVNHHIRDTGDPTPDAPIALLLHGLAGSTESWEDTAPLLYEQGIRAVAIDRVGFGKTERPKQADVLPPPLRLSDDSNPILSLVQNPLADFVESSSLPPPPDALVPEPLKEALAQVSDILPPPNKALATAIRRPSLLAPKLPWTSVNNPYSSDFAVEALGALVRDTLGLQKPPGTITTPRKLYLVGHSAGGPIALKAFLDLASDDRKNTNYDISGVALVAPAVLDPSEDPGIYDSNEDDNNQASQENDDNLRLQVFRSVLALPDALVVPIVRRIYDGRNLTEAVLNQTSSSEQLDTERINDLANKYKSPVEEFPDDWDVALLNVYRADFRNNNDNVRGRNLLQKVKQTAKMQAATKNQPSKNPQPIVCVISGDDDTVVPARASKRVASLLNGETTTNTCNYVELPSTGHLPMDEKPEEMARVLLDFIGVSVLESSDLEIAKRQAEGQDEDEEMDGMQDIDLEALGRQAREAVEMFQTTGVDVDKEPTAEMLVELESELAMEGGFLEDPDSDTNSDTNFSEMTVAMLKEECRSRGLKVSGRKAELIERLENAA